MGEPLAELALQNKDVDHEFYRGLGDTTVHSAIRCGSGSLIPRLLQLSGPSVLKFEVNGETLLMTALAVGYHEAAVQLSSLTGIDSSLVTPKGLTIFDLAIQNCLPSTILHLLRKEPSIMNFTGPSGNPPIFSVITSNQPDVLRFMISQGVDVIARG